MAWRSSACCSRSSSSGWRWGSAAVTLTSAIIVGLFFSGFGMAFFAIAGWLARTLTGRALKRTNASSVAIALVFAAGFAAADVAIARALSDELSPLSVAPVRGRAVHGVPSRAPVAPAHRRRRGAVPGRVPRAAIRAGRRQRRRSRHWYRFPT